MRKFQQLLGIIFIASFSIISCKPATKEKPIINEVKTKDLQQISFTVSGMTCEIGCARTIQSKLSKQPGITEATVVFKDSLALVSFDANRTSEDEISAFVNGIAGGDMYSVSNLKKVASEVK